MIPRAIDQKPSLIFFIHPREEVKELKILGSTDISFINIQMRDNIHRGGTFC